MSKQETQKLGYHHHHQKKKEISWKSYENVITSLLQLLFNATLIPEDNNYNKRNLVKNRNHIACGFCCYF